MADPLAGKRDAINAGELESLLWPDEGQGAPVAQGDIFKLRSCHIEITKVHRVMKGGWATWRAEFRRYVPHRELYLLGPRGYTDNPKGALKATGAVGETIDAVDEADRSEQHRAEGEPPEPEGVPPEEVAQLSGSREARQRYELEMAEARQRRRELPVERRLEFVRREAKRRHIGISSRERVIRNQVSKIEREVLNDEAA